MDATRNHHSVSSALASLAALDEQGSSAIATPRVAGTEVNFRPADSIDLGAVLSLFWRRRTALFCSAVAGLLAAATVTFLSTPVYRAQTTIQLESPPEAYYAQRSE